MVLASRTSLLFRLTVQKCCLCVFVLKRVDFVKVGENNLHVH